jgi:hypothetical protein
MYLSRAKKQLEEQDKKDFKEKRDRYAERLQREAEGRAPSPGPGSVATSTPSPKGSPAKRGDGQSSGRRRVSNELGPDDLPDGACFRPKSVQASVQDKDTAVRPAEVGHRDPIPSCHKGR